MESFKADPGEVEAKLNSSTSEIGNKIEKTFDQLELLIDDTEMPQNFNHDLTCEHSYAMSSDQKIQLKADGVEKVVRYFEDDYEDFCDEDDIEDRLVIDETTLSASSDKDVIKCVVMEDSEKIENEDKLDKPHFEGKDVMNSSQPENSQEISLCENDKSKNEDSKGETDNENPNLSDGVNREVHNLRKFLKSVDPEKLKEIFSDPTLERRPVRSAQKKLNDLSASVSAECLLERVSKGCNDTKVEPTPEQELPPKLAEKTTKASQDVMSCYVRLERFDSNTISAPESTSSKLKMTARKSTSQKVAPVAKKQRIAMQSESKDITGEKSTGREDDLVAKKPTQPKFRRTTTRKSSSHKDVPVAKKQRIESPMQTRMFTKKSTSREEHLVEQKLSEKDKDESIVSDTEDYNEDFRGWPLSESTPKMVPYQISIPAPPSNQLWTYNSICNIAFAKSRRGFIYKCLLSGCRFQTLVKETFSTHLEKKHAAQAWSGYCNLCVKMVGHKNSILDEYVHMDKCHISPLDTEALTLLPTSSQDKTTPAVRQLPKTASTSTPIIKKVSALQSQFKLPSDIILKSLREQSPSKPQENPITSTPLVTKSDAIAETSLLRPWLKNGKFNAKSSEHVTIGQSKECLSATYKCMSSTCAYYTIDTEQFRKHLKLHEQFTISDKVNFLMCSYCEYAGSTVEALITHIDSDHPFDRFQCSYCFYRSTSAFITQTHENLHHKEKPTMIIQCKELKARDTQADRQMIKTARGKNVQPMVCVYCKGKFFAIQSFLEHVAKHKEDMKMKCIKCLQTESKSTVQKHLKCHKFGLYQCIYCIYGSNTFEDLVSHISDHHPSMIPMFCERTENRNPDGTLKQVS